MAYWLSLHVPYACAHSGVCCASGWDIPVEREKVDRIAVLRPDGSWLRPVSGAPPEIAGVLVGAAEGQCTFRRDRCEIHATLGPGALPAACLHFPREVLIDPRGVFVTLSHYCPTAAELLFTHEGPVEIVEGPPAVPAGDPEGLDARDVLPPLLAPDVLMDHAGYSAWEAHMVRVLTREDDLTPQEALAVLGRDGQILQRWRPGSRDGVTLADAVARLPGASFSQRPRPSSARGAPRVTASAVIRRYLAARAFASWMAYQGGGLAGVLRHLRLTLDVLKGELRRADPSGSIETAEDLSAARTKEALKEAIRRTDLRLVHLTPRDVLARQVSERSDPPYGWRTATG